jgi:hypothetical protein
MSSVPGLWSVVVVFPDMPGGGGLDTRGADGVLPADGSRPDGDVLARWADGLGRRQRVGPGRGLLRFAFYGRVSTEDWQDPESSRARQLQQAVMLTAGLGVIVAEFFDAGESRTLPWARRPQAAALVAALADPDRGWDAIVIGEYQRAFYGGQYAGRAAAAGQLHRVDGPGFALQARCLAAVATRAVDETSCVVPVPAAIDAAVAASYLVRMYPSPR